MSSDTILSSSMEFDERGMVKSQTKTEERMMKMLLTNGPRLFRFGYYAYKQAREDLHKIDGNTNLNKICVLEQSKTVTSYTFPVYIASAAPQFEIGKGELCKEGKVEKEGAIYSSGFVLESEKQIERQLCAINSGDTKIYRYSGCRGIPTLSKNIMSEFRSDTPRVIVLVPCDATCYKMTKFKERVICEIMNLGYSEIKLVSKKVLSASLHFVPVSSFGKGSDPTTRELVSECESTIKSIDRLREGASRLVFFLAFAQILPLPAAVRLVSHIAEIEAMQKNLHLHVDPQDLSTDNKHYMIFQRYGCRESATRDMYTPVTPIDKLCNAIHEQYVDSDTEVPFMLPTGENSTILHYDSLGDALACKKHGASLIHLANTPKVGHAIWTYQYVPRKNKRKADTTLTKKCVYTNSVRTKQAKYACLRALNTLGCDMTAIQDSLKRAKQPKVAVNETLLSRALPARKLRCLAQYPVHDCVIFLPTDYSKCGTDSNVMIDIYSVMSRIHPSGKLFLIGSLFKRAQIGPVQNRQVHIIKTCT